MSDPISTNSIELIKLAELCEQATGPDRELDARIVVALDMRPDWVSAEGEIWIDTKAEIGQPVIRWNTLGKRSKGNPPIGDYPKFTASLDSAMTLVPEGCVYLLSNTGIDGHSADLTRATALVGPPEDTSTDTVSAATAPLALCSAALKARARASTLSPISDHQRRNGT